jgi:hypothetical protein
MLQKGEIEEEEVRVGAFVKRKQARKAAAEESRLL